MTRYEKFTLYLRVGVKGSGKSLLGAKDILDLLDEYQEVEKKYPEFPRRILLTSERLSPEIEKKELYSESNPNGHIFNWSSPKQLKFCPRKNCFLKDLDLTQFGIAYEHQNNPEHKHPLHDADIYWKEISNHFGADKSTNNGTPYWIKEMLSYCRKRSNRFFMDCQEYDDLAISFRRQLKGGKVYFCNKDFGSSDLSGQLIIPKTEILYLGANRFEDVGKSTSTAEAYKWIAQAGIWKATDDWHYDGAIAKTDYISFFIANTTSFSAYQDVFSSSTALTLLPTSTEAYCNPPEDFWNFAGGAQFIMCKLLAPSDESKVFILNSFKDTKNTFPFNIVFGTLDTIASSSKSNSETSIALAMGPTLGTATFMTSSTMPNALGSENFEKFETFGVRIIRLVTLSVIILTIL